MHRERNRTYRSHRRLLKAYEFYDEKISVVVAAETPDETVRLLVNILNYVYNYHVEEYLIREAESDFRMQIFEILKDLVWRNRRYSTFVVTPWAGNLITVGRRSIAMCTCTMMTSSRSIEKACSSSVFERSVLLGFCPFDLYPI